MSGLILPARFRRQPQYPAPVDWGNPLTSDLAFLYNPSVSDCNLVTGAARTGQAGAGLAIETGPFGRSAIAASSTAYRYWDVTFPTGPFTAAIFCIDTQRGVYRLPLHLLDSGGAETGYIRGEPGLVNARVRNTANVSANAYKSDYSEMSATESSLTALVLTPAQSVDLYVNGVGPGYSGTVSGTPRAISRILLCNDSSGGSTWSGQLYLVAIWRRALSVAELREFTDNPWQLFKYPRRNWADAEAGGAPAGSATVAGFAGGTGATTGQKSQSATAAGIAGGAESATGKKAQSTTALGIAGQGGTATARKAQSATILSFTGTGGAITGRKSQATTWLGTGGGVCVVSALHGGQTSVLGIAGAGGLISTVLNRSTTITGFAGGAGSATGQHGGAVTILGTLGGTGTNTARHAGNTAATGTAGAWAAFVGRKSQSTTYTVKAGGLGTITAVAGSVVEYSRAPSGMGSPLIYAGTERPAVISGTRPGNINTARPANRGGRRT